MKKDWKMLNYYLYWFSGSGNTLFIAQKLRELLAAKGCRVELRPLEKTNPAEIATGGTLGLFIPTG